MRGTRVVTRALTHTHTHPHLSLKFLVSTIILYISPVGVPIPPGSRRTTPAGMLHQHTHTRLGLGEVMFHKTLCVYACGFVTSLSVDSQRLTHAVLCCLFMLCTSFPADVPRVLCPNCSMRSSEHGLFIFSRMLRT